MSLVKAAQIALKLSAARNAARTFLGPRYAKEMEARGRLIREVAAKNRTSELEATMRLAKDLEGVSLCYLLAAMVELAEPSGDAG